MRARAGTARRARPRAARSARGRLRERSNRQARSPRLRATGRTSAAGTGSVVQLHGEQVAFGEARLRHQVVADHLRAHAPSRSRRRRCAAGRRHRSRGVRRPQAAVRGSSDGRIAGRRDRPRRAGRRDGEAGGVRNRARAAASGRAGASRCVPSDRPPAGSAPGSRWRRRGASRRRGRRRVRCRASPTLSAPGRCATQRTPRADRPRRSGRPGPRRVSTTTGHGARPPRRCALSRYAARRAGGARAAAARRSSPASRRSCW